MKWIWSLMIVMKTIMMKIMILAESMVTMMMRKKKVMVCAAADTIIASKMNMKTKAIRRTITMETIQDTATAEGTAEVHMMTDMHSMIMITTDHHHAVADKVVDKIHLATAVEMETDITRADTVEEIIHAEVRVEITNIRAEIINPIRVEEILPIVGETAAAEIIPVRVTPRTAEEMVRHILGLMETVLLIVAETVHHIMAQTGMTRLVADHPDAEGTALNVTDAIINCHI
jgi:hypothetical protein